jgi:hypothetical protein
MIVDRDRFKQAIMVAMADREMIRMLDCATFRPKSATEVIRETGVSHSTAYRKIKWMMRESLFFIERIDVTPDGKKFSLFRSALRFINIRYDQGKLTVDIEYNVQETPRELIAVETA